MSSIDQFSHNIRDAFDQLTEGWHQLWHKARNALTHFREDDGAPAHPKSSQWGLLSAELIEHDHDMLIKLEVPGMQSDDFTLTVEQHQLIIQGIKHYQNDYDKAVAGGKYHISERAYGSFRRLIPLPCEVDERAANASYNHGVLSIRLPKKSVSQRRSIKVES